MNQPADLAAVVGAFPPHVKFVRGARVPAADGSCRAAALLEHLMQAAH